MGYGFIIECVLGCIGIPGKASPWNKASSNGAITAKVGGSTHQVRKTSLDWSLLRALYARTGNPAWEAIARPEITEIARELGVTRNAVYRRLQLWRSRGFLLKYDFFPNPNLFGVGLLHYRVERHFISEASSFLDDLESIEGVFVATESLGDPYGITAVADSQASQSRRVRLLSQQAGVARVGSPTPVWLPHCPRRPAKVDFQLIAAIRRSPDESSAALAAKLRISPQTFARRLEALRASHMLLVHRSVDFSRFPGTVAFLLIQVRSRAESRPISEEIRRRVPGLIEDVSLSRPPFAPFEKLNFGVHVESASELIAIEAQVSAVPGVVRILRRIPRVVRSYSGWFDNRLEQELRMPPE
ncbi:MAG TPA: hypothetical protein VGR71_05865 [Nitrospira sp.]|nr:hypothetical protein [Nitrospira sp.]